MALCATYPLWHICRDHTCRDHTCWDHTCWDHIAGITPAGATPAGTTPAGATPAGTVLSTDVSGHHLCLSVFGLSLIPSTGDLKRKERTSGGLEKPLEIRDHCASRLTMVDLLQCPGLHAHLSFLGDRLGLCCALDSAMCTEGRGAPGGEGVLKLTFNFPSLKILLKPSYSGL